LMDPDISGVFFERLQEVAAGVAVDEGARMPGQGKREADPVELDDKVWLQVLSLAGQG